MDCRSNREVAGEKPNSQVVVPSKGLEPPHPCGYMDLNHARLPIPPRWQKNKCGRLYGPPSRKELQIYSTERRQGVKPCIRRPARSQPRIEIAHRTPGARVGGLSFELGVHRDLGVEHLRDRAPGLGIVRSFLKGGRVGAGHASNHIKM